eukprot:11171608-Alexandrium_andersonii.AAC.1
MAAALAPKPTRDRSVAQGSVPEATTHARHDALPQGTQLEASGPARHSPDVYACDQCTKVFASARALQMHQVTRHSRASLVSQRVDTVWCPACFKYFHTLRRCIHH